MAFAPQYLRADEEARIHRQFQGETWRRNSQVLWSGIPREDAQRWADEHEMQTLTTAMGPLMDLSHPLCLRNQKSRRAWSTYVKGASALFAWHISRGERVTVLSPPPPERFHPSGQTNYQVIEEPIVKGMLGTSAVSGIEMVHPTVKGAENITYQIWPVDDTTTWTTRFGELNVQKRRWRMVKTVKALSNKLGGMEIAKEEAKEKGKAKKEKKKARNAKKEEKKARNAKKEEKAKAKEEEKSKKEKGKEKAKAREVEKSKEKDRKKTRKAKKERKKARKAKKEKKLAKKKAKKLEKEEKASN